MSLQTIKTNIKTNLDALVTAGTLAAATSTDLKKDPLAADIGSYPHAFLMPPAIESEVMDNRTIIRTYTFDVMVIFKAENIASASEVEEKAEAILNKFDNDPTLGGSALAGVLPLSSSPEPFRHMGKDLIMLVVQIQAREPVTLTFA